MKKGIKKLLSLFAAGCCLLGGVKNVNLAKAENLGYEEGALSNVKNVIIMIGDGMGPNQVKAGGIKKGEPLHIQTITQTTYSATASANNAVTDSAAGGTALATGVRTNNGYVGMSPNGEELTTVMDIALKKGKRTGVVTTDVLSGATPMDFAAHNKDRNASSALLKSAADSGVNLFVSNTGDSIAKFTDEEGNVYTDIENVEDISETQSDYVIGDYSISASAPSMTANTGSGVAFDKVVRESLEYLSKDPDGFVLMAEGAKIDKCGHSNDFNGMIKELLAFDDAVKVTMDWADERDDTIVIVTADHETGGLQIAENATKENLSSSYQWTTTNHTDADVYCKVYGREIDFEGFSSEGRAGRIKNIDVFEMAKIFVNGGKTVDIKLEREKIPNGQITFDKEDYVFGDTLVITAMPNAKYEVYSLKVNGVEMISLVENNVLKYELESWSVSVDAKFRKIDLGSFDIAYEDLGNKGEYTLKPMAVKSGEKLTVKIVPSKGYTIDKVTFEGIEMEKTAENTYELVVEKAGTVKVSFTGGTQANPFTALLGCNSSLNFGISSILALAGFAGVLFKRKNG